jgi:uncharacterized protein
MVFVSPKICVKPSPVHRWGVFAVDFIAEGEVIEESPMVELEKSWIEKDDKILSKYRFNFPSGGAPESQQVCLGYGSLYNHSDQPNMYFYSVYYTPELSTYRFVASRDIEPNEEIFTSYGYDVVERE